VKLTATGRQLLKSNTKLKLTAKPEFTPTGGAETSLTKTFTLKT
jgi:hypothetical protein